MATERLEVGRINYTQNVNRISINYEFILTQLAVKAYKTMKPQ